MARTGASNREDVMRKSATLTAAENGGSADTRKLRKTLLRGGLGLLLATGIVIFKIRARLPIHQRDDDPDAWWAAHGMRVLVLWVLAESAATMGAVFWFLTSDVAMLVVLAASALLLLRLRPSVWTAM